MAGTVKVADLARVQDVEFINRFNRTAQSLLNLLGQTEPIMQALGTNLKMYRASGTLESGDVAEGADIPVSAYKNELVGTYEVKLNKWAKETTQEAVIKRGYDQAVDRTDTALIRDIQKQIKAQIFTLLSGGTGKAKGDTLQQALANCWGALAVAFQDEGTATPVYFVNPMDAASYLGTANVTLQTAFGMSYLQNFLGLGTLVVDADVPQGTVYASARENLNVYSTNMASVPGFAFYSDESGLAGVYHEPRYENGVYRTYVDSCMTVFPEYQDRIIVGTIGSTSTSTTSTSTSSK